MWGIIDSYSSGVVRVGVGKGGDNLLLLLLLSLLLLAVDAFARWVRRGPTNLFHNWRAVE